MDSGRQKRLLHDRLREFEEIIGDTELMIDHLETRIGNINPYESLTVMIKLLTNERKKLEKIVELYLKEKRSPIIC